MSPATASQLAQAWARLPDYLGAHVTVSLCALALGLIVSLPLALFARRRPGLRETLLGIASIAQTVPGLALLALFYPLLLAAASFTATWLGFSFSAFGFLPAVLALALYAMLPVMRNTITGLQGVNPELLEAAKGVGMTERQSLTLVELPLALPTIMAGIRTAAVWVIGTATLSTPIGQTSLGNYIFSGLQTQNWIFVLFGCAASALLALAVDGALALIENGMRHRRKPLRMLVGSVALLAIALLPLMGFARPHAAYVVGAKTFTEQYILSALIAERLRDAGLSAETRPGLGSSVIYEALRASEIDVYVDYTGTLWANQFHLGPAPPRDEVLAILKQRLAQSGITLLGKLGFENAYALVMPRARAAALNIHSIADLAAQSRAMSIAGDYEFFSRPEWAALTQDYGLAFRTERQMQPDFMYAALVAGEVDVIAGYTSDGAIAADDLVVLSDPKRAIPPYDAIVLIAPRRANDQALRDALAPLLGKISLATMRDANRRAAEGGRSGSVEDIAAGILRSIAAPQP